MKLRSIRLYAECSESVNKCWGEFEAIFSSTSLSRCSNQSIKQKRTKIKS